MRLSTVVLAASALVCLGGVATTSAQAQQPVADILANAHRSIALGDYAQALSLSRPITLRPAGTVERSDLAEAWRVVGLASFYMARHARARHAFLKYLKLDANAHLDPGLVPPEAIQFFADVRAQHVAEIGASRPRAPRSPELWKNFVPPWGQWQNGHRTKAIALGAVEGTLLATFATSFALFERWCDGVTKVCATSAGTSRTRQARMARTVNVVSGAALLAVLAYGVADGLLGYRRSQSRVSLHAHNVQSGLLVGLGARF